MACSGEKESSPCDYENDCEIVEASEFTCYSCQREIKRLKAENEQLQSQICKLEDQKHESEERCRYELSQLQQIIIGQKKEIDALEKVQPSEHCFDGHVKMAKEKSYDIISVKEIQDNLSETEFKLKKKEKAQNETKSELKYYKDKLEVIEAELRKSKDQLSNTQAMLKHNKEKCAVIEAELRKSKEQLSNTQAKLKHNKEKFSVVEAELRKSKEQLGNKKAELKRSNDKLKETAAELDVTRTRLSKAMGANLTDNYHNIAELSDQNRPTKLAEKYQELYDNQWTDAYEIIESKYKSEREGISNVETKAISILIKILMETKEFCEDEAACQTTLMQRALILERVPKGTEKCIPQEVLKQIKDFRRKVAVFSGKQIFKKYQDKLSQSTSPTAEVAPIVPTFVKKCFKICWLMTVQDPPLAFGPNVKRGDQFDTNMYKAYTQSGRKFDFVVWPAQLLHQDGPVLSKGIAQGLVEDD